MSTLEDELRSKKINPTAMRLLVLKFLKKQKKAVTLSDIEASFEVSDRVTIYRTVKTFESKGLIHSISVDNMKMYALCVSDCNEHHHVDTHLHFTCLNCKKTICLNHVSIPELNIPTGYQVDDVEVVARGTCIECSA